MTLISAIMLTTYPRRREMLAQAVVSFFAQHHVPAELLIVNDGEPLLSRHPRIRILRAPRGLSIGAKRNIGVEAAHGDLVATWDDDDFSMPDRLSFQLSELKSHAATYHRASSMWLSGPDLVVRGSIKNASYPTALMDRRTLLEIGGFPAISYLEDMEVFIRLSLRGRPKITSERLFYVHRRHDTNISSEHSSQTFSSHLADVDDSDRSAIDAANTIVQSLLSSPLSQVALRAVLPP